MQPRYQLLLDPHRLSIYRWQQAELAEDERFGLDPAGQEGFRRWLDAHPQEQLSLLANVAEEGFQLETLPYLRGSERQAVIQRRLAQHFFGTGLTLDISLGHLNTRRKEERVLLTALTQPALFDPWLQPIRNRRTPFAGLFSVPLLTGQLVRQLELPRERCLVLTVHPHFLRESLVLQGEVLFSRLTPLADSSIAGIAAGFASETRKLHQYLCSQRMISRDEPITACLLVHPRALEAVRAACQDLGSLRFQPVDMEQAGHKLGLKNPLPDSRADLLFLHLLQTHPPRRQFAETGLRRDYLLARLRKGMVAAGVVALAAGLLFGAREMVLAHQHDQDAEQIRTQATQISRRYDAIAATFPNLAVDHQTLKLLIGAYQQLAGRQQSPFVLLHELGHALDQVPEARLDKLYWQMSEGRPRLQVDGSLPPGDPRQTLERFERLVMQLEARQLAVTVLESPVDVTSDKALRGGDLAGDTQGEQRFRLHLDEGARP